MDTHFCGEREKKQRRWKKKLLANKRWSPERKKGRAIERSLRTMAWECEYLNKRSLNSLCVYY